MTDRDDSRPNGSGNVCTRTATKSALICPSNPSAAKAREAALTECRKFTKDCEVVACVRASP